MVNAAQSGLTAMMTTKRDEQEIDTLVGRYLRVFKQGKASGKQISIDEEGEEQISYKGMTNEALFKDALLVSTGAELRIARLKRDQELAFRPQILREIIAALFGSLAIEGEKKGCRL